MIWKWIVNFYYRLRYGKIVDPPILPQAEYIKCICSYDIDGYCIKCKWLNPKLWSDDQIILADKLVDIFSEDKDLATQFTITFNNDFSKESFKQTVKNNTTLQDINMVFSGVLPLASCIYVSLEQAGLLLQYLPPGSYFDAIFKTQTVKKLNLSQRYGF